MNLFVSNPAVNTEDKFIISFDVDFSENENTIIGFGCDSSSSIEDAFKVNNMVFIDNNLSLIEQSNVYTVEGDYILRKDGDNTTFFGYRILVDSDGTVYEEMKSVEGYVIGETKVKTVNGVVYREWEGKYEYRNEKVCLKKDYCRITSIYTYEHGELKNERYVFGGSIATFKGKLRYIVNANANVINISKGEGAVYSSVYTPMFSTKDYGINESGKIHNPSYIYLAYDGFTPKNYLIKYKEG